MSMYLPNDDVRPTGAEDAEFIDEPEPAVDAEPDADGAEEEADEGARSDQPAGETDANRPS